MDEWVAESHSILARWRNHFSKLLNLHGVNEGRQKYTVFEVALAVDKLKSYKNATFCSSPSKID